MKAKLIGRPIGRERQDAQTKRSYRAFCVEHVSIDCEENMKGDMAKVVDEAKNAVEGSRLLVYIPGEPKDSLPFGQAYILMAGVENDGTTPLRLEISGELYTAMTPYAIFEVTRVETAQKQKKAEPKVAPIDYDESIELGKKEKEVEYIGNGAGFEL